MNRLRLAAVTACLAIGVSLSFGSVPPLEELLGDPDAAESFDYCAWRFSHDDTLASIPDFKSILDTKESGENSLRAAALADAGTKIALASKSAKTCSRTFAEGLKLHTRTHEKHIKNFRKAKTIKISDNADILAVQLRIAKLWAEDQAARLVYVSSRTDDETGARFWAHRLAYSLATAADQTSASYLRQLLEQFDWVDAHRFGNKISSHAWILVQHADDHPEFQQMVLSRIEKYLADGGVKKSDYAHLWDRVAVNHGRKQRYGTQPDWRCKDRKLTLRPMEDPGNVDARRAEMGMGPVQQQLDEMTRSVCGG